MDHIRNSKQSQHMKAISALGTETTKRRRRRKLERSERSDDVLQISQALANSVARAELVDDKLLGLPPHKRANSCAQMSEPSTSTAIDAVIKRADQIDRDARESAIASTIRNTRATNAPAPAPAPPADPKFECGVRLMYAGESSYGAVAEKLASQQKMSESLGDEVDKVDALRSYGINPGLCVIGRVKVNKSEMLAIGNGGVMCLCPRSQASGGAVPLQLRIGAGAIAGTGGATRRTPILLIDGPTTKVTTGSCYGAKDHEVVLPNVAKAAITQGLESSPFGSGTVGMELAKTGWGDGSSSLVVVGERQIELRRPQPGCTVTPVGAAKDGSLIVRMSGSEVRLVRSTDGTSEVVVYGPAKEVAAATATMYVGEHTCTQDCAMEQLALVADRQRVDDFERKAVSQGVIVPGSSDNPKVTDIWVCISSGMFHDCRPHTCDALVVANGSYVCSKTGLDHGQVICGTEVHTAEGGGDVLRGAVARRIDESVAAMEMSAHMRRRDRGPEASVSETVGASDWRRSPRRSQQQASQRRNRRGGGCAASSDVARSAVQCSGGGSSGSMFGKADEPSEPELQALCAEHVTWARSVSEVLGSGEEYADGMWITTKFAKWMDQAEAYVSSLIGTKCSRETKSRASESQKSVWSGMLGDVLSGASEIAGRTARQSQYPPRCDDNKVSGCLSGSGDCSVGGGGGGEGEAAPSAAAAGASAQATRGGPCGRDECSGERAATRDTALDVQAYRRMLSRRYAILVVRFWTLATLMHRLIADENVMITEIRKSTKSGQCITSDGHGFPITSSARKHFRQLWYPAESAGSSPAGKAHDESRAPSNAPDVCPSVVISASTTATTTKSQTERQQQVRQLMFHRSPDVKLKTGNFQALAAGVIDTAATPGGVSTTYALSELGVSSDVVSEINRELGDGTIQFIADDKFVKHKIDESAAMAAAAASTSCGGADGSKRSRDITQAVVREGNALVNMCFTYLATWTKVKLIFDVAVTGMSTADAVMRFHSRNALFKIN